MAETDGTAETVGTAKTVGWDAMRMGEERMAPGFATTEIGAFGKSGSGEALRIAPDKTLIPLLSEERV